MISETESVNRVPSVMSQKCQFYVVRKGRYCKMTVGKGQQYCGEHKQLDSNLEENDPFRRVTCPLDGKHSCYAHQLDKHLKKCNARVLDLPEYVSPRINCGSSSDNEEKQKLSTVDDEYLLQLIKRIKMVATDHVPSIQKEIYSHPILSEELNNAEYGATTRKHLLQNASLLGHIENTGLFRNNTCYIEFGAGRGQLTYWIAEVLAQQSMNSLLIPIDRANNRHKFDKRHKNYETVTTLRLKVDIADLCLAKVTAIKNYTHMIGLSKHLCGVATDLSLRCLVQDAVIVSAILMAPCCHHRSQWQSYVGQEFLLRHKFTKGDFEVMCGIASWATCGFSVSHTEVKSPHHRYHALNLNQEEREQIGRMSKLLIDYGRLLYLKAAGFQCKILYYVDKNISPENICIVAVNNSTKQ